MHTKGFNKLLYCTQAGHVYICDLSEVMDGLPCRKGCYCAAPICLLYVNQAKQLVPIAIQLKKTPSADNPIFLPTDNWFDWVLAKMYFSEVQMHRYDYDTYKIQ